MSFYITPEILKERSFQELIKEYLINENGYIESFNEDYNRYYAINEKDLFNFLEKTQEKALNKLKEIHGSSYKEKILNRLEKELKKSGIINVLKHPVKDHGVELHYACFKPPTKLNEELNSFFEENVLSVTEELKYAENPNSSNENNCYKRIDLVVFLNGLPIITFELKNSFTGQTYKNAIKQYKNTRSEKETMFRFKERSIVNFAMDTDSVYMTTRLKGEDTLFLPFNQGNNGGAGNPVVEGKLKTHYMWEEILKKELLLEIIHKYVFIEINEQKNLEGDIVKKENVIFPRYHQLDSVRSILKHVKSHGCGNKYLVQHSAGSGKTNSITWLTHRLASLHNENDELIFDGVIVVSDRTVLVSQLQRAIYQLEHKVGLVEKINKDSSQLAKAIENGTKIIISTIQKFPYIIDIVSGTKDKKYAIVIDEAHSSSSGRNMLALTESLSLEEAEKIDYDIEKNEKDVEDLINEEISRIQDTSGVSFFAFTATPKPVTLRTFGVPVEENKYKAFHIYSMRQAIEERFILDVLKNYLTYKTYYKIEKSIEDDPELSKAKATKEIAKYVSLHPTAIEQKVEIIIEHFRSITKHKIGGRAKAMLVTSSRLHAVRYKLASDKYIKAKGYKDLKTLVAFSGVVKDDSIEFTEKQMNDISESQLTREFNKDEYRVLIVADKYQTGFDQPLLHTMYVDKKLSGVKAVQTLSRLNRINPGKEDTFILDFVNDPEDIKTSFQPFYEATILGNDIDSNDLYGIQAELMEKMLINPEDITAFTNIFYKEKQNKTDLEKMNYYIDNSIERIKELNKEETIQIRNIIKKFINIYMLVLQVAKFKDNELHRLNIYLRYLLQKIEIEFTAGVDIVDKVAIEYYKLDNKGKVDIGLVKEGEDEIIFREPGETKAIEDEKESLSVIIEKLNERFGTDFSESEKLSLEQIKNGLIKNNQLIVAANVNDPQDFKIALEKTFTKSVVKEYDRNHSFFGKILDDTDFKDKLMDLLLMEVYQGIKDSQYL